MSRLIRPGLGLVVLAGASIASGQTCQPAWGPGFPNGDGFSHEARAVAWFDDGAGPTLYATGPFQNAGGQFAGGIAALVDGVWKPLGLGLSPWGTSGGYWLGVLDDGSGPALYVAGLFNNINGVEARNVARWDGRAWTALGSGTNDTVRALAAFDDGSGPAIYGVGLFTEAGGVPAERIARWSGTAWSDVGGGLGGTPLARGLTCGVFDLGDGPKLYVGGVFNTAGGVPANNIARWDGAQWSALGDGVIGFSGITTVVMAMALLDDGSGPRLHVGGTFYVPPATIPVPRVGKWTGSQWVHVGAALGLSAGDYVNSLAVAGSTLYAGGTFVGTTAGSPAYLARLVNGEWTDVGGGVRGAESRVRSLTVREEPGGPALYAVGGFTEAGDAVANRVARWDGALWSGVETHSAPHGRVNALAVFDEGSGERLYVGGEFKAVAGRMRRGLATWDGAEWSTVGGGLGSIALGVKVTALHPHDDGSGLALVVGGTFDTAGGVSVSNIAKWDGAAWAPLGAGVAGGPPVTLVTHDDGAGPALYAAGDFTSAGGLAAPRIARWDGAAWSPLLGIPSPLTTIHALASFDDGSGPALYAGGWFQLLPSANSTCIVRWNGSQWSVLPGPLPGGVNLTGFIYELATFDDGGGARLYAGGEMVMQPLGTPYGLLRWDGAAWQSFGQGLPFAPPPGASATVLAPIEDGWDRALHIGGWSGSLPGGLSAWTGSEWRTFGAGTGWAGGVPYAIAARRMGPDRSLFVGGNFSSVDGRRSDNFAEWRDCPRCYADCSGDGVLTVADFGCFQTAFVTGNPGADCNADGGLSVADFGCFQTKFVLGCP